MYPKKSTRPLSRLGRLSGTSSPKQQTGSMLVISLFVIIVLAMLGATMSKMVIASNVTVVTDLTGLRAKNAAHTGLEVLGSMAFPLDSPIQACNTTVTSNANFNNITGFGNCQYTASCSTINVSKNGNAHFFYRFTSTGFCQVGDSIVSRNLSVEALQEQ